MILEESPVVVMPSGHSSSHGSNITSATIVPSVQPASAEKPTVLKLWRPLLAMCRPSNFIGVILLHLLGTKLAIEQVHNVAFTARLLFATLAQPSMMVVLIALLFTSCASMVVNDYYDTKSGVDSAKRSKPLVDGQVPMNVAKRFLSYIYASCMLMVTIIPGIPARVSIVVGLMLTFWYTRHLKPVTWLKNVVCAAVIALSPATSGSAVIQLLSGEQWKVLNATRLWRLVIMLSFGFLAREILMDCNDVDEDRRHKIRTVPVVYGRRFASLISVGCILLMSIFCLVGTGNRRQIILAATGSIAMLFRHIQVVRTEGSDKDVVNRAVEEGQSTFMLLLASFL
mmetsp:Transcript_1052/g.1916  ORF Transcript_1052/g.1916 Transcript_1052/m.1916 type:complete len:341 (-) Transcript_1052:156-1178(-)